MVVGTPHFPWPGILQSIDVRLLSPSFSVEMPGGLRCRTISQTFSCELVVKVGSFSELEKQVHYINNLPSSFREKFPKTVCLERIPETNQGVIAMEKLPGESLHTLLWNTEQPVFKKYKALRNTLMLLSDLHRHPHTSGPHARTPSIWCEQISERLHRLVRPLPRQGTIIYLLDKIATGPSSHIPSVLLHGDAQAGNFIIEPLALSPRFIDPLGGSGSGQGDYLYDLSRFYHWIEAAGSCLEYETNQNYKSGRRAWMKIRPSLLRIVNQQINQSMSYHHDLDGYLWFHLYSAFHLSGKCNDFGSKTSHTMMEACIVRHLKKCLQLNSEKRTLCPSLT